MLKLNTYIQYFEIKLILSINVSSLSLFENFNGTTGRDGFPGKRQKLVPGQRFGKEREIAVTIQSAFYFSFQELDDLYLEIQKSLHLCIIFVI